MDTTDRPAARSWRHRLRHWLQVLGPGFITGTANDDPSAIGSFAQVGAQTGMGSLWLLLLATPMVQVTLVTCAKLGMVTRQGLAGLLKAQYGLKIAVLLVFLSALGNIATIGADLAGIAAGCELIAHLKWQWFVAPVTLLLWYVPVYLDYRWIRKIMVGLGATLLAYVLAGILARPDWHRVLHDTFVPHLERGLAFFMLAVGMLGAMFSPYVLFFRPAQEVEEDRRANEITDMTVDTTVGVIFTNLVSYFIILSTAATLHAHGKRIETAMDAARALEPFAGKAAAYLFAVGLIASGMLAVPVLAASTATMIGEVAGWRVGLSKRLSRARGFYLALSAALFAGLALTLSGIRPMQALLYSQILNGVVAPTLLNFIFRLAQRRDLLGERVNSGKQQAWGWLVVAITTLSVLLMAWAWLSHRA